jgi:predicted RNA-binding protein with PUA-like domain
MAEGRKTHHWLMKAEPDSRIVKGKDVKFSVDDFAAMGITSWEGVRNFQARNIMRDQMKIGDKVLFYHSSCKVPGVAALAEVAKEAYPDHSAWDPYEYFIIGTSAAQLINTGTRLHPYYDEKTNKDEPRWYMVDLRFVSRVQHFVPLSVLKELPHLDYLEEDSIDAIKSMALINRSRLSVQPVSQLAYEAILKMGENGGFDSEPVKSRSRKRKVDSEAEDAHEEENRPTKSQEVDDEPPKARRKQRRK